MRTPVLLCACAFASAASAAAPEWARVVADPQLLEQRNGLSAYAVHVARAEHDAARAAIADHALAPWLIARLDLADGDAQSALARLRELPAAATAELDSELLRQLDRDHAEAAFAAGAMQELQRLLDAPRGDHGRDARWAAQRARAQWARGEAAAEDFQRALAAASESDRRRPVFAWRALALLAEQQRPQGGAAWLEHVEALRWPNELRAAIELFDQHQELAAALDQDGLRARGVAFLARILRRDQAFELARAGLAAADSAERAQCFVLAAEQLYRLRRDGELLRWLQQAAPEGIDDEGRAALAAYPWCVRRRGGASVEIADGFAHVYRDYPNSQRGLEALWEAAWMYELSGQSLEAEARFLEYARHELRGPLSSAAATRAIGLPVQRGDMSLTLERYDELRPLLRDSNDSATAQWLARLAGGGAAAEGSAPDSAIEHDPFRAPVPHPWSLKRPADARRIDELLQDLLREQLLAFQHVAERVGFRLADAPQDRSLQRASAYYRHGLLLEGDYELNAAAAAGRSDAALQLQSCWLAWSMGRAERQARAGFQLRALLQREATPALAQALDRIAHPTPFARELLRGAQEQDLPAGLLWAIMRRESFYDPAVVSLAGAYGLLQLLPSTAAQMADKLGDPEPAAARLRQPLWNLRYGSAYLRQLVDEAEGDLYRSLAAYNAGEANGERWAKRRQPEDVPQSMLFVISYSETRAYVFHVLRFWRLYADIYPSLGSFDGLTES